MSGEREIDVTVPAPGASRMEMSEFDAFFRTHAQPIYGFLRRLAGDPERASDLFQRTFFKAHTHFDRRRVSGSERSWIFTIAVNEARDDLRRRRRDLLRPLAPDEVRPDPGPDPSVAAEDRELAREILRGVESLPPAQRELFLLVRYHGFTFTEAAALAGVSLSAAKMSVARAHDKLMRLLASRLHLGSLL